MTLQTQMSFQAENSKPCVLRRIERAGLAECPERPEIFSFNFLFSKQNFTASDICLQEGSVLSKHFFFYNAEIFYKKIFH